MRRSGVLLLLVAVLGAGMQPTAAADARQRQARATLTWTQRLSAVIGDRPFSVAVGQDGEVWYRHRGWVLRPPASNEKLLLSMTLLDRFHANRTIHTDARTDGKVVDHVLQGNLWIVGHGDPETNGRSLGRLAAAIRDAGIRRIAGAVIGGIGPFSRDWFAPGWKSYFPTYYVPLPTALTYRANTDDAGRHITDPERRAAVVLTGALADRNVRVRDDPASAALPGGLSVLASVRSAPLSEIMRRMNLDSRNFWAEVLGKYLGYAKTGHGTIAAGAGAICGFIARHHVDFDCYDNSGLSYDNRASADGVLALLFVADRHPWAAVLQDTLPHAGEGTLEGRLAGVTVRAKTGTLDHVSALSGWIWTDRGGVVEFSILSSNFDELDAKAIEDKLVQVIAARALDPTP